MHHEQAGAFAAEVAAQVTGPSHSGARMFTIHMHQNTTATPEEFLAGLTDFGPGRAKLFPNSADEHLKVHSRGANDADVTEGSGGVWERLRYDWSDPSRVVMTTTESNIWGGSSGHTYTFTRKPDGTTDVDAVVVREGKNLKGRLLGAILGSIGTGKLTKAFATSVAAIEARAEAERPKDIASYQQPTQLHFRAPPPRTLLRRRERRDEPGGLAVLDRR